MDIFKQVSDLAKHKSKSINLTLRAKYNNGDGMEVFCPYCQQSKKHFIRIWIGEEDPNPICTCIEPNCLMKNPLLFDLICRIYQDEKF